MDSEPCSEGTEGSGKLMSSLVMQDESASTLSFANSKRTFRMSNKPLIGMNADYRAAARSMPAYSYVAAGYFQSIISAGGIPVVLPPMDEPAAISQLLDQLSQEHIPLSQVMGELLEKLAQRRRTSRRPSATRGGA